MTPKWYVPRRTVLRGLGTALALPFLEAMVAPKRARAQAQSSPRRFVGVWGLPCGLVDKWDPVQNCFVAPWTPDGAGPLTSVDDQGYLKDFFDPRNTGGTGEPLYKKLTLMTGLSDLPLFGHQYVAGLLSPGRIACNDETQLCALPGLDIGGPSADQLLAKYIGPQTPDLPYLALGATAPEGYGPNGYPYTMYVSWKDRTTPRPKDIDPQVVFDKLFTAPVNTM